MPSISYALYVVAALIPARMCVYHCIRAYNIRYINEFAQCVAVCCSVLQYSAVCCSVLQCVAVCCSVLQCVYIIAYVRVILDI